MNYQIDKTLRLKDRNSIVVSNLDTNLDFKTNLDFNI